jgi:peptidase E
VVHILLNTFRFAEPWCRPALSQYLTGSQQVLIFPLAFRPQQISSAADWDRFYAPDTGLFSGGLQDVFAQYGIPADRLRWVNCFTDEPSALRDHIRNSDVLYFCGGQPELLYRRLEQLDLLPALRGYDGIVLGDSAGAVIQLDTYHLTPDRDCPTFHYAPGIGWLHGFDLEVHDTASPAQETSIARVLRERSVPVYGIGDGGALVVDNGVVTPLGNVRRIAPA